ncbi:FUSC family protein [Rhodococcus artemisiae]|uniref:FUSC family protein n=2 Tax=Rhodococcus artemisiae TaxID=714159 RepID=A0ABU7LA35_9NOCA|nr:FUSC family protein [Rhodococcus artemisiae]MEE2058384.1 FUSC family protein [Rhodococcus artemisiae]
MSNGTGSQQVVGADLPIPAPAAPWSAMLAVPRHGHRWSGVARAALTVALPGLVGVAAGFGSIAAIAALGAFAVVYGEGRPYRVRWRVVAIIGAVLVALAGVGAAVGSEVHRAVVAGGSEWWSMAVVLTMTVVVASCAFVVDALRLGAPGAFLLLFTLEIASVLPAAGASVASIVAWTAIGAGTALIVAMSGVLARPRTPENMMVGAAIAAVDAVVADNSPAHRRTAMHDLHAAWQCLHDAGIADSGHPLARTLYAAHVRCAAVVGGRDRGEAGPADDLRPEVPLRRPSVRYRLARAAHLRARSTTIVVRLLVACPVAGAIAIALGVGRADWAVITAAMILHQGPDRILGTYRAAHRFVGTVLGLALLSGLVFFELQGAALVVVLALMMAGTESFLVRNYGLAMVFITPLAVILGSLGTMADLTTVARDRFLETIVGVAVALVVMWCVLPRAHRRTLTFADGRIRDAISRITHATDGRELSELRRDLEFDLHASTAAAITAAHSDPAWARDHWPEHRRLHELGYRILASPDSKS